jgi:molybdopterin biosynthesis enzyme
MRITEAGSREPEAGMRPIRETIPLDEALALVLEAATPIARTERVTLREATGRVLAAPAVAAVDVPPFDRAAMDGYAVIAEDTFGAGRYEPRVLRCIEKVYTGQVPQRSLARGECIEIATGAPMPAGADAVVMVEETEKADGDDVRIFTPVYPRQHVGRRAADIAQGQALLSPGDLLTASRIGSLAAIGSFEVEVYAKPRVTVLSTGNEIIEPGTPLGPGQIYDINQFTISSVVSSHGGIALGRERHDRRGLLRRVGERPDRELGEPGLGEQHHARLFVDDHRRRGVVGEAGVERESEAREECHRAVEILHRKFGDEHAGHRLPPRLVVQP